MYDLIVFFVTFIFGTLWMLDRHLKSQPEYKTAVQLPGPPMYPIVGNLFEVLFMNGEQTFNHIRAGALKFGKSARAFLMGKVFFNVIRAKDLEILLTSSKHIKKADIYKFIHPLMGTGLLTSVGQKWFHRRKILTPAFHFNILQDYMHTFREESHKMVEELKSKDHENGTDLLKIIPRFTLNTICETAMGIKLDSLAQGQGDEYRKNILKMGEWLLFRAVNAFLHLDFLYKWSGLSYVFNKYCDKVHKFSWSVISQRRLVFQQQQVNLQSDALSDQTADDDSIYGKKKRCAMLDTLFTAEASSGAIDELGIREEVDTFMFEGFDTTSSALVFTLFMLAHHKNWQSLALEEIQQVLAGRNETELGIQDYSEMKVLTRIIKETLRLYPPVAFMGREVSEPIKMNNVDMPMGSQIYIHVFDLHRDPEQFPDPEKFDPDRFLPDALKNVHPLAYIPFSAGPRNCIGQKFAMLEIQTLVTNILLNYELSPITKVSNVAFVCDLVLRPKYPIVIKFSLRN